MGPPDRTSPVALTEQKLDIAGLIAGREESPPVPGLSVRASAVRLANRKTMLIVPAEAPADWVESQLLRYDFVCIAGEAHSRVTCRFEDFLSDQLFR